MPTLLDPSLLLPDLPAAIVLVDLDESIPPLPTGESHESIAHAVPKRRHEFIAGRHAARLALATLGYQADAPLPPLPSGGVGWPPGFIGSIAHDDDFALAAVTHAASARALGIDIEPDAPLPADLIDDTINADERAAIAPDPEALRTARLIFSAKESVQKVRLGLGREPVELHNLTILIDTPRASFTCAGYELCAGRFLRHRHHLITAAWMRDQVSHLRQP